MYKTKATNSTRMERNFLMRTRKPRGEIAPVNRNNTIRDNEISGYGLRGHCIAAAAGVKLEENQLARNLCSDRR